MTGLLFDVRPVSLAREPERPSDTKMQKGAGPAGRPVDAGDAHPVDVRVPVTQSDSAAWEKSTGTDGVRRARGSEIPLSPDVLRVIHHSAGPFYWVVAGKVERYYEIVQFADGTYAFRFTDDGTFRQALDGPEFIERRLAEGMWREVRQ